MNLGSNYKSTYKSTAIPLELLCDEMSVALHVQTFRVATRPVGLKGLIVGWDSVLGMQIYSLEPDGNYASHNCVCIGGRADSTIMDDFANDSVLSTCNTMLINDVVHSLFSVLKQSFRKQLDSSFDQETATVADSCASEFYEADVIYGRLNGCELVWSSDCSINLVG